MHQRLRDGLAIGTSKAHGHTEVKTEEANGVSVISSFSFPASPEITVLR